MRINEESLFAVVNPIALFVMLVSMCVIGIYCARKYRNTNDFAKSTKLYLPLAILMVMGMTLLWHIPFILAVGIGMCGFFALSIASNHYFKGE